MSKKIYDNTPFKSNDEVYCLWYLQELKDAGYVVSFDYECKSINLSDPLPITHEVVMKTKVKHKTKNLIQGHSYLPDFEVVWNVEKAHGIFFDSIEGVTKQCPFYNTAKAYNKSYLEVKPAYDQNNMTREFRINQKWIMEQENIFVNLFVPEKVFAKTFTPKRYLQTDFSMSPRKLKFKAITLEEYVGSKL